MEKILRIQVLKFNADKLKIKDQDCLIEMVKNKTSGEDSREKQYYTLYFYDVSEKMTVELKNNAIQLMNQLFKSISHEFSTSLNGIQLLA